MKAYALIWVGKDGDRYLPCDKGGIIAGDERKWHFWFNKEEALQALASISMCREASRFWVVEGDRPMKYCALMALYNGVWEPFGGWSNVKFSVKPYGEHDSLRAFYEDTCWMRNDVELWEVEEE